MSFIHADLPEPIDALVHNSFFQDLDKSVKGFTPVKVFEVKSYPESVPTFTVWVPEIGGTFYDLPPHAITFAEVSDLLEPEQGSYNDCPDHYVTAYETRFTHHNGSVCVFLQDKTGRNFERQQGRYLFSLDWYEDNQILHGIQLSTGHFTLQPPHKTLFNPKGEPSLPRWKKFHQTWRVFR